MSLIAGRRPAHEVGEKPGKQRAGVAGVETRLEETGFGGLGGGVVGGAVSAFAKLAAALAHSQAEHQHEKVAQGVLAVFGVVHLRLLEDVLVMLERVLRRIAGHGFGHLDGIGILDAKIVVDLGVADGHAFDVARRRLAAIGPVGRRRWRTSRRCQRCAIWRPADRPETPGPDAAETATARRPTKGARRIQRR